MAAVIRPRTKPAEERRQEIIKSALALFESRGVDATTIDQITTGAGVAKGTFYLYFTCKEDVLEALRGRFVESVVSSIFSGRKTKSTDSYEIRLSNWVKACFSGYIADRKLHDIVFLESPPLGRDGLSSNPIIDNLASLLAEGDEAKAWSVNNPTFTAVFLFNALHGIVNEARNARPHSQNADLIRQLQEHFFRTVDLKRPPSSARRRRKPTALES